MQQNIRDEIERILKENEDYFRSMVDGSGQVVFPITHTSGIITANGENLEKLLGESDLATTAQINELFYGAYDELNTLKEIGDAIKKGETSEATILASVSGVKKSLEEIKSNLTNYLTSAEISDTYAKKSELPSMTNVVYKSEIANFLTAQQITEADTESIEANGTLADGTPTSPNVIYYVGV